MTVPKLSGFNCPNCGAPVEMRTFGQAVSVVCPSCHSVLDAKDPNFAILQKAQAAQRIEPQIPLGSRGQLEGVLYEVIGFQVRTENDPDDGPDSWREYLLFNPYRGYRYLTEYQGHWNFVRVANAIPELDSGSRARMAGTTFQFYARANAVTTYVIGEFPWEARVGDSADAVDYIAAPQVLSSETTPDETVWSIGHYIDGNVIWEAFKIGGASPAAQGVAGSQPVSAGPHLWSTAWKLVAAAFLVALLMKAMGGQQVYRQGVILAGGQQVTPPFEVTGHESNLEVEAKNQGSQSFYMHYALVDQASGQARSFSRSIGADDHAVIPSVRPGRYTLRMEAEQPSAQIDLTVRRNVPSFSFLWITVVLLLIPPIFQLFQRATMERSRWQGSSR